jgi:hypothetical protein
MCNNQLLNKLVGIEMLELVISTLTIAAENPNVWNWTMDDDENLRSATFN